MRSTQYVPPGLAEGPSLKIELMSGTKNEEWRLCVWSHRAGTDNDYEGALYFGVILGSEGGDEGFESESNYLVKYDSA